MSKIGSKLIAVFLICLMFAIIVVGTLSVFRSSMIIKDMMGEQTGSGVNTIEYEMNNEIAYLTTIVNTMNAFGMTLSTSTDKIGGTWDILKQSEKEFAAFADLNGNIYWKSENFTLADTNFTKASSEGYSGVIMDSEANLTIQVAMPVTRNGVIVGGAIVGRYMSDYDWIDEIGNQTNSEITIFGNNIRIGTTLKNSDGSRAVGTEMSESIAKLVLTNGETYIGTADLFGEKHYVQYKPIYDLNDQIVGAMFSGVSAVDSDNAMGQMIILTIIVAVIIAVIALVFIGLIVIKLITGPVKEANKIAENMSNGILNNPNSTYHFSNDEIGDLVHKFESTKADLNSYISDINYVLSEMATGDFTVHPGVDYTGDFIDIKKSYVKIESEMSEIVGKIITSAYDVKTGAHQIAEASQVLADGTTKQAAAIEELSASINEIADKVQFSAQNASEASKISTQSSEKITYQNVEITSMLNAMEEIKEKSDQIQNIIKTIDDIAFQTNILALNAAIEAERAGSAGKGFAVVADEVRNLAAKSAESAQRTGQLINATIEAVDKGTVIAQSTADTMKEVIELSDLTNRYIKDISGASDDQAKSISQIKAGIEDISTVVQQNSATAEETAASCEELRNQSSVLETQVNRLKVEAE